MWRNCNTVSSDDSFKSVAFMKISFAWKTSTSNFFFLQIKIFVYQKENIREEKHINFWK